MNYWSEEFEAIVRAVVISPDLNLELKPQTSLADLALDSLSIMSMITEIEYTFGAVMPAEILTNGIDTTLTELWSFCARTIVPDAVQK